MVQVNTENEPDLLENLKIFVSGRGRPRKPRQSQVDYNSYASFFSNFITRVFLRHGPLGPKIIVEVGSFYHF